MLFCFSISSARLFHCATTLSLSLSIASIFLYSIIFTTDALSLYPCLPPKASWFLLQAILLLFHRLKVDRSRGPCYPHCLCFQSMRFPIPVWSFAAIDILLPVFDISPYQRKSIGSFGSSSHMLGFGVIRTPWPCWSIDSVPIVLGSHWGRS